MTIEIGFVDNLQIISSFQVVGAVTVQVVCHELKGERLHVDRIFFEMMSNQSSGSGRVNGRNMTKIAELVLK